MCKLGDIIVVKDFKNEYGEIIPQHSFVVINDEPNYVEGLKYDFVSNMLCSFHNEEHKNKKMKYKSNLPIKEQYISGEKINAKEGYIKANQLYYFDKEQIEFYVFAHMEAELLDELVQLILVLDKEDKITNVVSNLQEVKN